MEGETAGTVEIQFSNGSESSLTHQGEYSVTPDLARLQTTLLSFVSQTRELALESPFEARFQEGMVQMEDRKSTRLNSSHVANSYAVFCLQKKRKKTHTATPPS